MDLRKASLATEEAWVGGGRAGGRAAVLVKGEGWLCGGDGQEWEMVDMGVKLGEESRAAPKYLLWEPVGRGTGRGAGSANERARGCSPFGRTGVRCLRENQAQMDRRQLVG